jgi:hypothetical protein
MLLRRITFIAITAVVCALALGQIARAAECMAKPAVSIELNSSTPRSLDSPDKKWRIYSVPGHSFSDDASVFLSVADTDKKWRVVWMKRRGMAYFSDDSHWLVFRDDYLVDDSFFLVYDLSGSSPKEIKHVNSSVREAIAARIPKGMMAEYVRYPDFCFSSGTAASFILLSDTPVLKRPTLYFGYGYHPGKGVPFFLRIEVTLPDAHATATPYTPTKAPGPSEGPSPVPATTSPN